MRLHTSVHSVRATMKGVVTPEEPMRARKPGKDKAAAISVVVVITRAPPPRLAATDDLRSATLIESSVHPVFYRRTVRNDDFYVSILWPGGFSRKRSA